MSLRSGAPAAAARAAAAAGTAASTAAAAAAAAWPRRLQLPPPGSCCCCALCCRCWAVDFLRSGSRGVRCQCGAASCGLRCFFCDETMHAADEQHASSRCGAGGRVRCRAFFRRVPTNDASKPPPAAKHGQTGAREQRLHRPAGQWPAVAAARQLSRPPPRTWPPPRYLGRCAHHFGHLNQSNSHPASPANTITTAAQHAATSTPSKGALLATPAHNGPLPAVRDGHAAAAGVRGGARRRPERSRRPPRCVCGACTPP